jgi:ABC-type multidrug transport system fused ATPase/permease subunit
MTQTRSNTVGVLFWTKKSLAPHLAALALATAGLLLQSMLLLPVPVVQGRVLDRLVTSTEGVAGPIAWAMSACVGCLLLRAGVGWLTASAMQRVSLEVVRELTDLLHRKLQGQPRSYFDRHSTGDLLSRLTADVGSILLFLNGAALQLFSDVVLAAGVAVILTWLDWRLALVAALAVPPAVVGHRWFAGRARRLARSAAERTAEICALVSEQVAAIRVTRAFAREPSELSDLDDRLDDHHDAAFAVLRAGSGQSAWSAFIGGAGTVCVVAFGTAQVRHGAMTAGDLLAFLTFLAYLYQPIVRLGSAASLMAGTFAAAERITAVLDLAAEIRVSTPISRHRREKKRSQLGGRLEVRCVTFAYGADQPPVLRGVSFTARPGETVGIVGPAGAGKSTLLALACGLYPVRTGDGEIRLNGRKLRNIRPARLRQFVGLVPQQATLFGGTIRSNLTYAVDEAAETALWRMLEAVDLADLVLGLPDRLETPVGQSGFTLSGGQRQRLALARALLAGPAVLLMDDCTSGLDAATEANVQVAIARLAPAQTRLVVSHREATLRRCDRVITLDAGRIVEFAHAEPSGPNSAAKALE